MYDLYINYFWVAQKVSLIRIGHLEVHRYQLNCFWNR